MTVTGDHMCSRSTNVSELVQNTSSASHNGKLEKSYVNCQIASLSISE